MSRPKGSRNLPKDGQLSGLIDVAESDSNVLYMRLELLKLTHRPDKDAATCIDRAKEYEKYITGQ